MSLLSEADEQKEIIRWFKATWPDHKRALRVSQSGGFRGRGHRGAIAMGKAKQQGAVPGEADIAILLPRGGFGSFLMEHKADGSAHKATDRQIEYIEYHNIVGNCAVITRGVDAAKAAITQYMALGPEVQGD